jgi:hypothetical protein
MSSRPVASDLRVSRLVVSAALVRTNLVDQNSVSWNPVISWLRRIERLKFAE